MADTASLRKIECSVIGRAHNWISKTYYKDINLNSKILTDHRPVQGIFHWIMPSDFGKWQDYKFSDILKQDFTKIDVGLSLGPIWSTHWFKLVVDIPEEWSNEEVHLLWDSSSEALAYTEVGEPIQGFSSEYEGKSSLCILEKSAPQPSKPVILFIEVACNGMFGGGKDSQIGPPDPNKTFMFKQAEIAIFHSDMYGLSMDVDLLINISKNLGDEDIRKYDAMYTANDMANKLFEGKFDLAGKAAKKYFDVKNSEGSHVLAAIGHCHIDTAWLWPISETIRKCARSWSSVLKLLEQYPDMVFACSQAQQYEWVQKYYPSLFEKIKTYVALDRFVPTGATWVEMDANIPSGESFIRQFLYGQMYFLKSFNRVCTEFWLPDTFGYSPQLPQIMKIFGINFFLTQKLSWSLVNKFPHHNFFWKGIDGSQVLVHFPPGDSYEMKCRPEDAIKTVKNLKDKGRVDISCMLYGFGDGGGGPTKDMLERMSRLKNCAGIPKFQSMTPGKFFSRLVESSHKLMTWDGELYLELHNGTYTTQAKNKLLNRRCEFGLQHAEMLVGLLIVNQHQEDQIRVMKDELDVCWKKVLVNQFHDIIPGTSIQLVYEDSSRDYLDVTKRYSSVIDRSVQLLLNSAGSESIFVVNSCSWPRLEVVRLDGRFQYDTDVEVQTTGDGAKYGLIQTQAMGVSRASFGKCVTPATVERAEDGYHLSNGIISAIIDDFGRVSSLKVCGDDREAVGEGALMNQLTIFEDTPFYWDAWDILDVHLETRTVVNGSKKNLHKAPFIVDSGPLLVSLKWEISFGDNSTIQQTILLKAESPYLEFQTDIFWNENRKFLKVEFPMNVRSTYATYEIQFGHIKRNTTTNTSWDWAQYEVYGHKWADMSEFGFGVSVLNDSKYGWSGIGNVLSLSLLKAPKLPDPTCDMGRHSFTYALMPHIGTFQEAGVIQRSYELNQPLKLVQGSVQEGNIDKCLRIIDYDLKSVILETVKPGEESPGNTIVLRLFESYGGSCVARLKLLFGVKKAFVCSGLEKPLEELQIEEQSIKLPFRPFQVQSVLCYL